jgi:Protein of unknown function (DUF2281)
MDNTLLYSKLASLPENIKAEVADFIDFLLSKKEPSKKNQNPKFGSAKGMFIVHPGFDESPDDFKEYMQ